MTAQASFKQKDVERACKAAIGAGLQVARVRVSPDGAIDIIIVGESAAAPRRKLDEILYGKNA